MEFSRQEYWSGLPFPSSRDLSDPGTEPRPPALQAESLPSEPQGKPWFFDLHLNHLALSDRLLLADPPKMMQAPTLFLKTTLVGVLFLLPSDVYVRSFLYPFYTFFSFIFISWRLITLQYCSDFYYTLTWISHGFTCIPHPDPPPTSLSTRFLWVFPVHQAWALVSCIWPGLVICFTLDNIHVSMLFSWNIPPSPSPTESKILFCTSVSLFLFCL